MRAKSLLLTAVLLISGLPAYLGAAETITGRLDMEYEESGLFGPIRAFVEHLDPDSGRTSIVQIVGWDVLPDLPPSFKSGATVTVAVSRDIPTNVPGALLVTRVEVITPAPLRPVSVSARRMAVKSSESSWGKDLPVLVLRPRLPENCKPGSRVGGGSKEEWKELIAKVSNLQTSCTNGQLSYQEPVVTDYFDIPCTEMGEVDDGCSQAAMQWYLDAVNYAKTNLSINVESFRHVIGDLPMMEGCGIMGRGMFDDNRLYYNSYVAVELEKDFLNEDNVLTIAHEMGHNYGLTHTDRLQLGKNGKLPKGWERHYGTDDTSNIMGYDNVLSCFNLPQSEAIGLASAKRYGPTRLPAGKKINLRLKPLWGPNPQGAVIATGKKGQHDLRIWASYLVTTDSGFKEGNATLLPGAIFNRAVVLDISTTRIPYNTSSVSYSHRVRTMQSGEIFEWPATGLVFKYRGISKDGEHANVWVCRETGQKKCRLRITPPPLGEPVQLRIAALPGNNCLQACDSDDCRLPRDIFSKRLNNVYFASNCSNDSNTLWRPMIYASGFRRYVSVATGECLTAEYGDKFREPLYIYGKDADNWRMALEACQTDESMDTRDNPQLFLPTNPERDPEAEPVWLESPVYIPGCEHCGDLKTVCAGVGSVQSPYLPKPTADVTYRSVVSTVCSNQDETEFIQEVSPA